MRPVSRQGRQVYVEGSIRTRQHDDKDGNKRYITEIIAQRVQFLGGRGGDSPRGGVSGGGGDDVPPAPVPDDDDIPF